MDNRPAAPICAQDPGADAEQGEALAPADVWRRACAGLNQSAGPALKAIVERLSLVSLQGDTAIVHAPAAHVELARSRAGKIETALRAVLGRAVRVETREEAAPDHEGETGAGEIDEAIRDDPLVRGAIEVFDARIVRVGPDAAPAEQRREPD